VLDTARARDADDLRSSSPQCDLRISSRQSVCSRVTIRREFAAMECSDECEERWKKSFPVRGRARDRDTRHSGMQRRIVGR
jgi:hypothetical protein